MVDRFFESRAQAAAFATSAVIPYVGAISATAKREFLNALIRQAPREIDRVSYPMVYRALRVAGVDEIPTRFRHDFPPCAVDVDVLSEPLFLSLALADLVGEHLAVAIVGELSDTVWVRDPGDALHMTGPISLFETALARVREPPCLSWDVLWEELQAAGAKYASPPSGAVFTKAPMGPLPSELADAGWLEYS